MKNKHFEYRQLADLLQKPESLDSKDIGIYTGIFQIGKVGRILVYLVGLVIGFVLCAVFNINPWWTLLFAIAIGEIIGLYTTIRGDKYRWKIQSEQWDRNHLRDICNKATDFIITITLKTAELGKYDKQIDAKKAKEYYNHITLQKHDDGWLFSGRKAIYLQQDLTKEPEIIFASARNEFFKDGVSQNIIFPCPKTKSNKQIYTDFDLIADDECVHFRDSEWCPHTNYPGYEKYNNNLKNIDILFGQIRKQIFERIVNAFQPYNDEVNSASSYWSKKYLFKSDEYRKQQLDKHTDDRTEYECSQEFAKIKYGPLGTEQTTDTASYGVYINPVGKIKYTHKYDMDWFSHSLIVGCTHTFETEFFTITIKVNNDR